MIIDLIMRNFLFWNDFFSRYIERDSSHKIIDMA